MFQWFIIFLRGLCYFTVHPRRDHSDTPAGISTHHSLVLPHSEGEAAAMALLKADEQMGSMVSIFFH